LENVPQQNQTVAYRDPAAPPESAELAPLFPQLEIFSLLGRGGMGGVYKARQPHLSRLVALKILAPRVDGPAFSERFAREARTLARLGHPRIASVYDSGLAGGLCYLLMEYVEGMNLREMVRAASLQYCAGDSVLPVVTAGRVAPDMALWLVDQVCEALEYAHAQGVVHRDIKPENILMALNGQVKLADFGLAKLLEPGADVAQLTVTGQVMGTLRYMAPEQMDTPHSVDHRADIYSLGVVLYEMLTGGFPVGRFPPPSRFAPVDPGLDAVVLRALEKDPERRFSTVAEFRSALKVISWAEPVAAPIPPTEGSSPAAPAPQSIPAVATALPMPPRLYFMTMGGFALAWVAACFLWNLGFAGLAIAYAPFLILFIWTATPISRCSDAALVMSERPLKRTLRLSIASFLFTLGCFLLVIGLTAPRDRTATKTANDLYPLDAREFSIWFRSRENELAPGMGPIYAQALQLKGLPAPPPNAWPRLTMSMRMYGFTPGWGEGTFSFGVPVGLGMLFVAFGFGVGWRPLKRLCTLAGAALLPYFLVVLLPILVFNPFAFQSGVIETRSFANRVEDVREILQTWAIDQGYDAVETSSWYLHPPDRPVDEVGQIAVFHLRRSPVTARWRLRPGTLERTAPDLLVVCADCSNPRQVLVQVIQIPFGRPAEVEIGKAPAKALIQQFENKLQKILQLAVPLPLPERKG
jgi:tRNA A-37 threonylcarbamoyl transferase component Bud32